MADKYRGTLFGLTRSRAKYVPVFSTSDKSLSRKLTRRWAVGRSMPTVQGKRIAGYAAGSADSDFVSPPQFNIEGQDRSTRNSWRKLPHHNSYSMVTAAVFEQV